MVNLKGCANSNPEFARGTKKIREKLSRTAGLQAEIPSRILPNTK
jgi:hypothetical protein